MLVKRMSASHLLLITLLLLSSIFCSAQSYKNEAGFMLENDAYIAFQQDRYYTDGTFAYFRHALKQENLSQKIEKQIIDFEIGQKIYNPFWSHAPDVKTHDRPFAGYLYGGGAMSWFFKNEAILKTSAQIGVLGPSSFAAQTQSGFHKLIKAYYEVEGWDYQVKNEMALNFDVSYQHLLFHSTNRLLDVSGATSVLIGNTFSGANAGLLVRFGNMNPFYESSYANSRIKNKKDDHRRVPVELFLFTKPQLNFAVYDATIQGGLFRADKGPVTFGIKNWVYSQQIGVNFAWKRLSSKFIVTLKTKEVNSPARAYHYGSAVFAYNFD